MTFMAERTWQASPDPPAFSFEEFYIATFSTVVRHVYLIVRNLYVAEELTQDAMMEVLLRWDSRRTESTESNRCWTVGIAVNFALRHRRRVAVHARSLARLVARQSTDLASAEDQTLGNLDAHRRIVALPRRERAIALLIFVYDMSAEQVADVLGLTPSTVRTCKQRILRKFRSDATDGTTTGQSAGRRRSQS